MSRTILFFLIASIWLAPASQAQFGSVVPESVVEWTAAALPPSSASNMTSTFDVGDRVYVTLSANIDEGWRVYSLDSPAGRPLVLELDVLPGGIAKYGVPGQTQTRTGHDPGLDADYTYYDGHARVWQGLEIRPGAASGEHTITGSVRYAACNDEMCLPVKTFPFSAQFVVNG